MCNFQENRKNRKLAISSRFFFYAFRLFLNLCSVSELEYQPAITVNRNRVDYHHTKVLCSTFTILIFQKLFVFVYAYKPNTFKQFKRGGVFFINRNLDFIKIKSGFSRLNIF